MCESFVCRILDNARNHELRDSEEDLLEVKPDVAVKIPFVPFPNLQISHLPDDRMCIITDVLYIHATRIFVVWADF